MFRLKSLSETKNKYHMRVYLLPEILLNGVSLDKKHDFYLYFSLGDPKFSHLQELFYWYNFSTKDEIEKELNSEFKNCKFVSFNEQDKFSLNYEFTADNIPKNDPKVIDLLGKFLIKKKKYIDDWIEDLKHEFFSLDDNIEWDFGVYGNIYSTQTGYKTVFELIDFKLT